MDRKILLAVLALALVGCADKIEGYLENPQTIVQDPHFGEYQQKLDDLEKKYLSRKITYAEYLEQKKGIDKIYTKEVQHREDIINNPSY